MTAKRALLAASALLAALTPLNAQADAAAGHRLAQQWCANCHVVDSATPKAAIPQGPPSFATIAGHLEAGPLRAFLAHPHQPMPDLTLSRSEIEDLASYIESLR